jgi:hypothetical protein
MVLCRVKVGLGAFKVCVQLLNLAVKGLSFNPQRITLGKPIMGIRNVERSSLEQSPNVDHRAIIGDRVYTRAAAYTMCSFQTHRVSGLWQK